MHSCRLSNCLVFLCVFQFLPLVELVSPVWRTPVSSPKKNLTLRRHRASHSNPNATPYYSRPEDYQLPDYRLPKPQLNPERRPKQMPITPPGFRAANHNYRVPYPQRPTGRVPYSRQFQNHRRTNVYPNNRGHYNVPRYPPGWVPWNGQLVPVQALPYLNGAGPISPQGAYGPRLPQSTKQPMLPSYRPDTFTGSIPMHPSVSPSTIPSETSLEPEPVTMETLFTAKENPFTESTETHSTYPSTESYEATSESNNSTETAESARKETTSISQASTAETELPTDLSVPPIPLVEHTQYFPRPVNSQSYQPPAHIPDDFSDHIDVKLLRPNKTCTGPLCGIDKDKVSLYTPPKGPTLVISNVVKDNAARLGYIPPNPRLITESSTNKTESTTESEAEFTSNYKIESTTTEPYQYEEKVQTSSRGPHVFIPPQNFPAPQGSTAKSTSSQPTTTSYLPTAKTIATTVRPKLSKQFTSRPSTTTETTSTHVASTITTATMSSSTTREEDLVTTPSGAPDYTTVRPSTQYVPTYKPLYTSSQLPTENHSTTTAKNTLRKITTDRENKIEIKSERPIGEVMTTSPVSTTSTSVVTSRKPPTTTTSDSSFQTSFEPTYKPLYPEATTKARIPEFKSGYTTIKSKPPSSTFESSNPPTTTKESFSTEYDIDETTTPYYVQDRSTFEPYQISSTSTLPPFVPNRVRGKTRVVCKEDGIEFIAMTLFPFTGQIFANERKRVPGCSKTFKDEESPTAFFPFTECGVKNAGVQDQRTQYHMQVVVVVEQQDGTSTIQSFMAQCVHQKIQYNKQTLPKRIEEALEELKLVVSRLEQKAPLPQVDMRILVDNHHELGPEVSEVDIGMPLALQWRLLPESDAYGFSVRNCMVIDTISGMEMSIIDEHGCSTDLSILNHPHYDTYHDTASAHMWAFKVPDHSKLRIKCDITICSDIPSSTTNISSCAAIPTPPFCPDLITSPPNSILYDAEGAFLKRRRQTSLTEETQTVRAALCTGDNCVARPAELLNCIDGRWIAASLALSLSTLLVGIVIKITVGRRKYKSTKP